MKKEIKNQKRYAQVIRASFQKFLGYYEHNSVTGKDKEKMRKELIGKAKEVIKSTDRKIIDAFSGKAENQAGLRLVRVFNKEKEIETEGKRIKEKFKQIL